MKVIIDEEMTNLQKAQVVDLDYYQLIDLDGNSNEKQISNLNLDDSDLSSMYEWMLKARQMDKKLLNMQRQGRIGTYSPFSGQEAAQIGSAMALKETDWMFPTYRDLGACIVNGIPIQQIVKYLKGHLEGSKTPENVNILPLQIIIGGQIPQAAGCAWASKLRAEKDITITYFGDGATSQGDFHEGMNFASVFNLPIVFFCQNNHWAISVPFNKQSGSETIVQKAEAYGMKGIRVDGNDVLAVYKATKEAIDRARNNEGPTLIEAVTYRQGPHTTSDDPTKYRDQEEVSEWTNEKDPLVRFERFLEKRGLLTEEKKKSLMDEFDQKILNDIKEAEETIPTTIDQVFDYVYDHSHSVLQDQKNEVAQRILAKKGDIHG